MVKAEKGIRRPKGADIATRDYTIHMSKRLYGVTFKKRAPRAISEIKKFAQKAMGTRYIFISVCSSPLVDFCHSGLDRSNVRIDTALNKYVWSMGIRNVAKRIRVRLERRRDEDEEAKEKVCRLKPCSFMSCAHCGASFCSYTPSLSMFKCQILRDSRPKMSMHK